jgi:hypothetical protein
MSLFKRKTPEEKAAEERERQRQKEIEEARKALEVERARRIKAAQDAIQEFYIHEAPKWEYFILEAWSAPDGWCIRYRGEDRPFSELTNILVDLGNRGWELVGVSSITTSEKPAMSDYVFSHTTGMKFYFKRPKPSLPGELVQALRDAEAYG